MRFIHTWSYNCADFLTKQLSENHEKRRVYYYGFQIVLGGLIKALLLIIISLLLGILLPTLIILFVFAVIRSNAGGYHMDTYGKCMATSLTLFVASGAICQYTYYNWEVIHIFIFAILSFLIALFVFIRYAPSDTPNKPITKPEDIRKFKKQSIIVLIAWLIAVLSLLVLRLDMYKILILPACFGLLLEVFTVSPIGYTFFDKVSGKVDQLKSH